MTIKSIWLRRIHKWVGLAIGLQFVLWTVSGAAMALLDMETVAGGPRPQAIQSALAGEASGWPAIVGQLDRGTIEGLRLKTLLERPVVEVRTARSTQTFDARTGVRVTIDAPTARAIAQSNHPNGASPGAAKVLTERSLPVRDQEPPIWRVDFADDDASTYYVSATTGAVLERRNDTWRWWDFFWMLHNMDYADRTSFNHPLVITAGIAMAWLAVTGFWLLFRTMWRHDFVWIRIGRRDHQH
ncbi:MAG: hypothetical protein DI591_10990 [Citromicrobium sp.]|nr:MAG: hypothetical protein DI591_10990 [Citromicrobium sp.]